MAKPADIDAYLALVPPEPREVLQELRRRVHDAVPGAVECIAYQMPAFRRGKVFFYFAAFKKHIGIFPPLGPGSELLAELAPYRNERGNLAFPLSRPIPVDLIVRVAVELAQQYGTPATR